MDNLCVIDGDLIPYAAGFACQTTTYSIVADDGTVVEEGLKGKATSLKYQLAEHPECTTQENIEVEELGKCLATVKGLIRSIIEGSECTEYKVYLTGATNYRDDVATLRKYKGNRDGSSKPVHWKAIRDYLTKSHGAITCEGIEADDAVSIVSTNYRKKGARCVIATFDKDLNGTPGLHYNFQTGKHFLYDVTEEEALYFFYKQVLTGDLATDNIQGIPRVGDKKAEKILAGVPINDKDLCEAVRGAYKAYMRSIQSLISTGRIQRRQLR